MGAAGILPLPVFVLSTNEPARLEPSAICIVSATSVWNT